jgi:hypothetical protein
MGPEGARGGRPWEQSLPEEQLPPVQDSGHWKKTDRALKVNQAPVNAVTGKAFFDIGHAPKDQSNRRKNLPRYAAWEIHPS